ncbi:CDP-archaeol synthase [Candidatus Woesearchaeota archaeon]|nr:CDP-archaeol synthase [Candidatus Woesearchaeota archaeon]
MILEAFYYFLPAYVANTVPPLLRWIPFLGESIDFSKRYRGKRIFGKNKTIRGFLGACILGTLMFYIQKLLYQIPFFNSISIIDYSKTTIWLGFLLAFGAIFGDAIKSFFKRQIGIASGKPWIPFDQIDYLIVALLLSSMIFLPSVEVLIWIVVLSVLLPPLVHYLGYLLGVTKDKI